jgi:membrane protein implicated in regulation of membrane protease activity
MVGSTGRALTAIDGDSGEVKVAGEIWQARSFSTEAIEAGTPVEIFEVDGTTVVVYPKEP